MKVNQTKLCWNEQDLYFHQKTIREYSVKHDSFFHTCLTFCKYVWEKPNLCVKYHTCSFWQMFDFYPTCLEKTKNQTHWYIYTWVLFSTHVWILTHRYGKRHTCVQKATQLYVCKCLAFSTHVWEKPLTCLFPPELWVIGGESL